MEVTSVEFGTKKVYCYKESDVHRAFVSASYLNPYHRTLDEPEPTVVYELGPIQNRKIDTLESDVMVKSVLLLVDSIRACKHLDTFNWFDAHFIILNNILNNLPEGFLNGNPETTGIDSLLEEGEELFVLRNLNRVISAAKDCGYIVETHRSDAEKVRIARVLMDNYANIMCAQAKVWPIQCIKPTCDEVAQILHEKEMHEEAKIVELLYSDDTMHHIDENFAVVNNMIPSYEDDPDIEQVCASMWEDEFTPLELRLKFLKSFLGRTFECKFMGKEKAKEWFYFHATPLLQPGEGNHSYIAMNATKLLYKARSMGCVYPVALYPHSQEFKKRMTNLLEWYGHACRPRELEEIKDAIDACELYNS